jgi:hypothetical protein
MKTTVFWDVTPHSLVDRYQRFGGKYCTHLPGMRHYILSMEAVAYSKALVMTGETIWLYIPEGNNLQHFWKS